MAENSIDRQLAANIYGWCTSGNIRPQRPLQSYKPYQASISKVRRRIGLSSLYTSHVMAKGTMPNVQEAVSD